MNWRDRLILVAGAIVLAAYGRFLYRNLSYSVGGPDTGGYMNEARMIAEGRVTRPVELVRVLGLDDSWLGYFMPLGFAPSKGGAMHATYPAGLPFHLAAAGLIGGWKRAPYFVAPLAAIGVAILMVAVGKKLGIPLLLGIAGAAAICLGPAFLWHAVQPASDVLATFWTLVAMWLALSATESQPRRHGEHRVSVLSVSLWLSIAAGVAFGIGVWVRPTNILIALPLALIVHLRWKPLLGMAAGALPFGVALMVWSAKLYGSPFRTGYGDISMTWEGVLNAAPQHAQWLLIMLSALVFPLGLLVVFDRMVDGWTRVMLAVWFVSFFVFYSFYGFFDGWLCIRFLLPAIPALIFGTLLLLRDFFVLVSRYNRAVAAAIVAGAMLFMCKAPVQSGFDLSLFPILGTTEISYPHYISWVERRLPKRAVVVTGVLSGGFLYYANRSIVRYDQLNDERFQILRAYAGMQNLPWYAVVSDEEIDFEALRQRFRGDWKFVAHLNDVTIYRLDS